jgi:hypothetical protein
MKRLEERNRQCRRGGIFSPRRWRPWCWRNRLWLLRAASLTALAYAKGSTPDRRVASFAFDPMPMVGPRALDIDEVVPESVGGSLRFAVRAKLEKV